MKAHIQFPVKSHSDDIISHIALLHKLAPSTKTRFSQNFRTFDPHAKCFKCCDVENMKAHIQLPVKSRSVDIVSHIALLHKSAPSSKTCFSQNFRTFDPHAKCFKCWDAENMKACIQLPVKSRSVDIVSHIALLHKLALSTKTRF